MQMQMAMMQSQQDNLSFIEPDRNMTAPSGFGLSKQKTRAVHDHAGAENVHCTEENCEYQIRGRQICLGECKFVFERVWRVTCNNHKDDDKCEENQ
jgi:hypothetical protein